MSIVLNQTELAQLTTLRAEAQPVAGCWHPDEYLAQVLDSRGVPPTDPVLL